MPYDVGIYGDSFVGSINDDHEKITDVNSWTYKLHQDYGHKITNYGFAGTGVDYSYYHFLKTHHLHEKIIFVAANIFRGTLFIHENSQTITGIEESITNLKVSGIYGLYGEVKGITSHMNGIKTTNTSKRYIENKFLDWAYSGYSNEILSYYSMISHIKMLRPDVYFVYAFDLFDEKCLWNITKLDAEKFQTYNETSRRTNHMSRTQNEEVAKYVNSWIDDNFDFPNSLHPLNTRNYYTISNDIHQSGLASQ